LVDILIRVDLMLIHVFRVGMSFRVLSRLLVIGKSQFVLSTTLWMFLPVTLSTLLMQVRCCVNRVILLALENLTV